MIPTRPLSQGRKRHALTPRFGVNGINALGLDQQVAVAIHEVKEIPLLNLRGGVCMGFKGDTASKQASQERRSICLT